MTIECLPARTCDAHYGHYCCTLEDGHSGNHSNGVAAWKAEPEAPPPADPSADNLLRPEVEEAVSGVMRSFRGDGLLAEALFALARRACLMGLGSQPAAPAHLCPICAAPSGPGDEDAGGALCKACYEAEFSRLRARVERAREEGRKEGRQEGRRLEAEAREGNESRAFDRGREEGLFNGVIDGREQERARLLAIMDAEITRLGQVTRDADQKGREAARLVESWQRAEEDAVERRRELYRWRRRWAPQRPRRRGVMGQQYEAGSLEFFVGGERIGSVDMAEISYSDEAEAATRFLPGRGTFSTEISVEITPKQGRRLVGAIERAARRPERNRRKKVRQRARGKR
jgi:hypothetical protein